MNDELLNVSYIEQAIDQVLTELKLPSELLTQAEKIEKSNLKIVTYTII